MIKRLCIILAVSFSISGCAHVNGFLEKMRPVGSVLLDTVETADAIASIKSTYLEARADVQSNRDVFSDAEWDILRRGNDAVVELAEKIKSLKSSNGGSEVIVYTNELVQIILPLRDAITAMMTVVDAHFGDLSDEAQRSYLSVIEDYGRIDQKMKDLLSGDKARAGADMLIDWLSLVSRLIGIASLRIV